MLSFLSWYILLTLLGWITFPLAYHLFPALADRGYTLSRAFGLLIWGYVFWLFATLGLAQNDLGGLLLGLAVLGSLSVWAYLTQHATRNTQDQSPIRRVEPVEASNSPILAFLKQNKRLILATELLFLLAFAFMSFARASNPETQTAGGEKWMEVAFINAILHSPTFPPHDPWLSGYAISYYYFGYVLTSMLAMFTSTAASVAHNLMLSAIFALSAIGAYGILYNLLAASQTSKVESDASERSLSSLRRGSVQAFFFPLLSPLFLLIISNAQALFESLHRRGVGWTFAADGSATSAFWKWIDLRELNVPPPQPLTWIQTEFFWWWRASRVLRDYEFNGTYQEVIDEFPFFSYLLGDLHPHVLAMPFVLLAITMALNIFLGGWRGSINLYFGELKISKSGFVLIALMLGGLAFLNTWDILIGAALIAFSYALARVRESGWGWGRVEDILLLGIPSVIVAYVMYLPFFIGFDSQAGGIVPNFMFVARGAHLWVMWGTLFIPLFCYLIYLSLSRANPNWRAGVGAGMGLVVALLLAMFAVGLLALRLQPDLILPILQSQGMDANAFIIASLTRRWQNIGALLTLLALLIPALSFLFSSNDDLPDQPSAFRLPSSDFILPPSSFILPPSPFLLHPSSFILLLIALGILLILGPDFFYLRDNFGYRINTVFKFYYQAWILLALAASYSAAVMFSNLRGLGSKLYSTLMVVVIAIGLIYPVLSLPNKTDNFKTARPELRTLDGSAYLASSMPDDYQAIQFITRLDQGVVAEAVGGQYSEYARVATFTGMSTVLGWPGHEGQWRDYSLQGSRQQDIETLYATPDWATAQAIIQRYDIRYIYVGNLERSTYRVNEEKFNLFLKRIFPMDNTPAGSVVIYEVP